ncbi:MAG TPA: hypothetical protein VLE02_01185 [Nitrosarchaeum sp.]|nr:hypothetical protein [Nitrosarchaeum sp.]
MKINFIDKSVNVSNDLLVQIPYFEAKLRWDKITDERKDKCEEIIIERDVDAFLALLKCVVNSKYAKLLKEQSSLVQWKYLLQEFSFYGININDKQFEKKCECHTFGLTYGNTESTPSYYNQSFFVLQLYKDRSSCKLYHNFLKQHKTLTLGPTDVTKFLYTTENFYTIVTVHLESLHILQKNCDKICSFVLEVSLLDNSKTYITDFISSVQIVINSYILIEKSMKYYEYLAELKSPLERDFDSGILEKCKKFYITIDVSAEGLFLSEIIQNVHFCVAHASKDSTVKIKLHINGEMLIHSKREELRNITTKEGYATLFPSYTHHKSLYATYKDFMCISIPSRKCVVGFIIKVSSDNLQIPVNKISIRSGDDKNSSAVIYDDFGLLIKKKMLSGGFYIFDNNIYYDYINPENHIVSHYGELFLEIDDKTYPPPYAVDVVWIINELCVYGNGNLYYMFS